MKRDRVLEAVKKKGFDTFGQFLLAHRNWSDREMAADLGIGNSTLGRYRRQWTLDEIVRDPESRRVLERFTGRSIQPRPDPAKARALAARVVEFVVQQRGVRVIMLSRLRQGLRDVSPEELEHILDMLDDARVIALLPRPRNDFSTIDEAAALRHPAKGECVSVKLFTGWKAELPGKLLHLVKTRGVGCERRMALADVRDHFFYVHNTELDSVLGMLERRGEILLCNPPDRTTRSERDRRAAFQDPQRGPLVRVRLPKKRRDPRRRATRP